MGYILALIIGIAVLVLLLVAFMGGKRRPVGRASLGKDITHKEPAADEATPGASDTAGNRAARAAQERTPPA
jgi:hypothetical protein